MGIFFFKALSQNSRFGGSLLLMLKQSAANDDTKFLNLIDQSESSIPESWSVNCFSQYFSHALASLYTEMSIFVNAVHLKSLLYMWCQSLRTPGVKSNTPEHNSYECVWWHVLSDILVHSVSYSKLHLCFVSMVYRGWIWAFYTQ